MLKTFYIHFKINRQSIVFLCIMYVYMRLNKFIIIFIPSLNKKEEEKEKKMFSTTTKLLFFICYRTCAKYMSTNMEGNDE